MHLHHVLQHSACELVTGFLNICYTLYQGLTAACNTVIRFFEDYKRNENKDVRVDEILGVDKALDTVMASMVSAALVLFFLQNMRLMMHRCRLCSILGSYAF